MAEQSKESSMEEILSSIKRIIAEDKAIDDGGTAVTHKKISKPISDAVPDIAIEEFEEVLELTEEVEEEIKNSAQAVIDGGPDSKQLIDDEKLESMRQSLSALVAAEPSKQAASTSPAQQGTSLEDMTREMMRPMIKQWLDANLPQLVEDLVAKEIRRINQI